MKRQQSRWVAVTLAIVLMCGVFSGNVSSARFYEQGFLVEKTAASGKYLGQIFYRTDAVADEYRFTSDGSVAAFLSSGPDSVGNVTVYARDGYYPTEIWSIDGVGQVDAFTGGGQDAYYFYTSQTIKSVDSDGNVAWNYESDPVPIDFLLPCPDGVFLAGAIRTEAGAPDLWQWRVIKLNDDGTVVTEVAEYFPSPIYEAEVSADGSHVFLLTKYASTVQAIGVSSEGILTSFDPLVQETNWLYTGGALLPASDNGVFISSFDGHSFYIARFDSDGNLRWQTAPFYSDEYLQYGFGTANLLETKDGGAFLFFDADDNEIGMAKTDENGNQLFAHTEFAEETLLFYQAGQLPDGKFILAGEMYTMGGKWTGFLAVVYQTCTLRNFFAVHNSKHEALSITDMRIHADGSYELLGPAQSRYHDEGYDFVSGCGC